MGDWSNSITGRISKLSRVNRIAWENWKSFFSKESNPVTWWLRQSWAPWWNTADTWTTHTLSEIVSKKFDPDGEIEKWLSTETQLGATWNGRVAGGARWRVRLWRLSAAVHTLYIHTHTNTYNTHRYICVQTARTLTMCYPRPPSGGAAPNTRRFYWAVLCGLVPLLLIAKKGRGGRKKRGGVWRNRKKILVLLLLLLRVGGAVAECTRTRPDDTLSSLCVCFCVHTRRWISLDTLGDDETHRVFYTSVKSSFLLLFPPRETKTL
jgi:hypothetical protein